MYIFTPYQTILREALSKFFKLKNTIDVYGPMYKYTDFSKLPNNITCFNHIFDILQKKYLGRFSNENTIKKCDDLYLDVLKENIQDILKKHHIKLYDKLVSCQDNGDVSEQFGYNVFDILGFKPELMSGNLADRRDKIDMIFYVNDKKKKAQIKSFVNISVAKNTEEGGGKILLEGNSDMFETDLKKVDVLLLYKREIKTFYMLNIKHFKRIYYEENKRYLEYTDYLSIWSAVQKKFKKI